MPMGSGSQAVLMPTGAAAPGAAAPANAGNQQQFFFQAANPAR